MEGRERQGVFDVGTPTYAACANAPRADQDQRKPTFTGCQSQQKGNFVHASQPFGVPEPWGGATNRHLRPMRVTPSILVHSHDNICECHTGHAVATIQSCTEHSVEHSVQRSWRLRLCSTIQLHAQKTRSVLLDGQRCIRLLTYLVFCIGTDI